MDKTDFCRIQNWYPVLGEYAALTGFLKLSGAELDLLAQGATRGKEVRAVINRLKRIMRGGAFDNYFISTDVCAPTDTERFAAKRGAVHSAESGWYFLAKSQKVQRAVQAGEVEYLCIRPFLRIDRTREFRLFVHDGELRAMSQYNLVRHFRRLEGIRNELWKNVLEWFEKIKWRLPEKPLVMDIHLDGDEEVGIIDLNVWGPPTDPLLLRSFDRDWHNTVGIVLMPSPTKISGDVAVSF